MSCELTHKVVEIITLYKFLKFDITVFILEPIIFNNILSIQRFCNLTEY